MNMPTKVPTRTVSERDVHDELNDFSPSFFFYFPSKITLQLWIYV